MKILKWALFVVLGSGSVGTRASTFTDDFNSGPSPLWGNEVGTWVAAGGVFDCTTPNNIPPTYTGLPFAVTDTVVDVDVNAIRDGGIWLHSSNHGTGVLLVTGGYLGSYPGFYWHICHNGTYGPPIGLSGAIMTLGSNVHVRATVVGNVYSVYLNGSTVAASSISTTEFPSGRTGLYDFSSQTFDNFSMTNVPKISGHAYLTDFVGETSGEYLQVEVFQGSTLVETLNGNYGPDGSYAINPSVTGALTLKFKTRSGLRKAVSVTAGSALFGVNVTMVNGDVDNSGEVDAIDIDGVIAHFGQTPSSSGFLANADVDGSAEVDAIDIDIVISHFGSVDD